MKMLLKNLFENETESCMRGVHFEHTSKSIVFVNKFQHKFICFFFFVKLVHMNNGEL